MYKYFFNLLEGQYLFEKLRTSRTEKTTKNIVTNGCFWKLLRWREALFMRNARGCKTSCYKTVFQQFIRNTVFF